MSYEQTMKSERQNNKKIKKTNERNESEQKKKSKRKICSTDIQICHNGIIWLWDIAHANRFFCTLFFHRFIFILRIFLLWKSFDDEQSKSFVLERIPLWNNVFEFYIRCFFFIWLPQESGSIPDIRLFLLFFLLHLE